MSCCFRPITCVQSSERARSKERRRSSRACKIARATRNGRAARIVKSSFHNYSYELRFSYASAKNSCSEPLELSPPILDSSTSAPAKKKRKGKRNAEKRDIYIYMYIFYEVSSVESASQKARSPPPHLLCPSTPHPRARYIVRNILFFYSYYLIFICATFRFCSFPPFLVL